MVKDLTNLEEFTLENKTNEVVAIRHYLVNFVEKLNPGDTITLTPKSSEELAYYIKIQEEMEEDSGFVSDIELTRELAEEFIAEAFTYWATGIENYGVVDFVEHSSIEASVFVQDTRYPEGTIDETILTSNITPIPDDLGGGGICVEDLADVDMNNVVMLEYGTRTFWYEAINHYLVAGKMDNPR